MKTNTKKVAIIAFILLFAGGIFLMSYLQGILQGTTMTLGVDLYPRWVGAQAVLAGNSPYGFETRQMIWQTIYGSSEIPAGNPFGFYYPPAITTILFPFILGGVSLKAAAVGWCALTWALWTVSILLWIVFTDIPQKARLFILPVILLSGIAFRPAYSNYLLGQYSLLCVIMLVFAWLASKNKYFILAGILGALSLIKFSITILPIALLFLIYARNWKAWLSFIVTSLALYLPPTLILGWWIPDFIKDISGYALENAVAWNWTDVKTFSGIVWLAASLIILAFSLRNRDYDLLIFTGLAMNSIFIPHTADYDLVVFIPMLFLVGYRMFANKKMPSWFSLSVFVIMLWFPWFSLIYFIGHETRSAVEDWYRFIWLVYPLMVLISVFAYDVLTNLQQIKTGSRKQEQI